MPPAPPSIAPRTASAAAAAALRERIFAGVYPAGTALRQDALAAELGVSRIPVREALVQLEAEGLVKIAPHKGASVAALDSVEALELYDLRALIEPELAALSVPRLTAEDLAGLDAILAAFGAPEAADPARWGALNTALHLALYARAGRARTLALTESLLRDCDRFTRLQLTRAHGFARAAREHAELVALARKGDATGAARLTRGHIVHVREELARILGG